MTTLHRWVRHHEAMAYIRLGWLVNIPDRISSHDHYSVLMSWICQCEPKEP